MSQEKRPFAAVVIGTSWGGLEALRTILAPLPKDYPFPIMIVQHRRQDANDILSELLQHVTDLLVKEADSYEAICSGTIYTAPANYHLLVERDKRLTLSIDAPVHYSRPAIDVLFETAADAYQHYLIGVLLTGASHDGTAGLQYIKARGGYTVVQDPKTAKADIMPRAAIAGQAADLILSLPAIAHFLTNLSYLGQYGA